MKSISNLSLFVEFTFTFKFTFTFAAAVDVDDDEEDDDDEEEEEQAEEDVSLVDAETPFSTIAPSALPAPAPTPAAVLQGTLARMYKAGFDVYDMSPQRAIDVSQRSRTCLDFMMSCGRATSMTAENASRSLLKSEAAGRESVRFVLETTTAEVAVAVAVVVAAVVVAVEVAVVAVVVAVAGRPELKT